MKQSCSFLFSFSFVFFITCAFTLPAQVHANYSCVGYVVSVGLDANDNTLDVNNGYGVQHLCSLNEQHPNSYADQTLCRAWYAGLLASKLANQQVTIYYENSTGKDNSACSQVGNWVWPADKVYYVDF